METFEKFGIKESILRALSEIGFESPTEVQAETIPEALANKDLIVRSKTGSGKTAAFAIPILQRLSGSGVQALVIAPTRELALQIEGVFRSIGKYAGARTAIVYGGVSINPQIERIERGANIVVGTPGRIIDLMERGALDLSSIKTLVLDEADIMLEMGFIEDIQYIIEKLPPTRQMMLFSATMPKKIKEVAYEYMRSIKSIEVGGEEELAVKHIENTYALVSRTSKFSTLLAYIEQYKPRKAIIFSKMQRSTEVIYRILRDQGYSPIMLHGGMTQAKREYAMQNFRHAKEGILIATNVAARGIDIVDVSDVINFDAPEEPAVYLHRVGRSARMGRNGRAFTIFNRDQHGLIGAIERFAGVQLRKIVLDNRKFSNINYGEHIRASVGYRERGPRRWEERGHDEHRQGHGGYGRGHQRHGRFRPQHQRRSY